MVPLVAVTTSEVVLLVPVLPDVVLSPRPGTVLASVIVHGWFGQV